jgi:hypothetical protein
MKKQKGSRVLEVPKPKKNNLSRLYRPKMPRTEKYIKPEELPLK